jgi:hypothetical protein
MSLARLYSRLAKVEAQWRPWVVADVLLRAQQGASSERDAFLRTAVTTVDGATASAIMQQLTEAEFKALLSPEMRAFVETLTESELEALAHGDPVALQRLWRSYQRGRNGRA